MKVVLPKILGTRYCRYESPWTIVPSCMLLSSFGVSQMKFDAVAELSSAIISASVFAVVGMTLRHRAVSLATSEKNKKGTCLTSGLEVSQGLEADSEYALQVSPTDSKASTIFCALKTW